MRQADVGETTASGSRSVTVQSQHMVWRIRNGFRNISSEFCAFTRQKYGCLRLFLSANRSATPVNGSRYSTEVAKPEQHPGIGQFGKCFGGQLDLGGLNSSNHFVTRDYRRAFANEWAS